MLFSKLNLISLRKNFSTKFYSVQTKMVKRALIFLADGAEEMETVITADVLVRGGIEVVIAGVNGSQPALCSRNVKIVPDVSLDQVLDETFDAVIIPGGLKGAKTCSEVENFFKFKLNPFDFI